MALKFFVAENAPNGTVIGYLPGVPASANFSSYDLDEDYDGVLSISFNPTTTALIVTDAEELDYEALGSNLLNAGFFLNGSQVAGTPYQLGYNEVQVFVQDVIDESVNGTAGNDTLATRNTGDTTIRGLGGNDTLIGSKGNDTLIGGKGRDIVTGGNGNDTFIIGDGTKYSKAQKVDRVTDFYSLPDSLVFDKKTFGRRLSFESINVNSYSSENEKAGDSLKTLVYDQLKGLMYFNENGARPGFGKGGLIVQFSNTLAGDVSISASNCRMGSAAI